MAVRSRRMFQDLNRNNGTFTIFTCPAARTAVIRSLVIVNQAPLTATIRLRCGPGALPGYIVRRLDLTTLQHEWLADDIILNPGDNLVLTVDTVGANVTTTAFGSLLDGEPE